MKVWELFDYPCGQRLAPAPGKEIARLRPAKELVCSDAVAAKLKVGSSGSGASRAPASPITSSFPRGMIRSAVHQPAALFIEPAKCSEQNIAVSDGYSKNLPFK